MRVRHPRRRQFWKRLMAVIAAIAAITAIDALSYPSLHQPAISNANQGENGIWLLYTWYFGDHSASDWAKTAARLKQSGIRYAYFHVRSVQKDGSLAFRKPESARALNANIANISPEIRRIAWIYAGNRQGHGEVNLSDPATRRRMVSEAVWLVREGGFQGIQWDYEACPDGDQAFLALMRETRNALPQGTFLSAAVPIWMPPPFTSLGWSERYFGQVAQTCDQLAVMCYDTGATLPRAYVWLVGQEVIRVTRAVAAAAPDCRVVFGLPTYDHGSWSHVSQVENLAMGLKGIEDGLASGQANPRAFAGIALFADYTTDNREWSLLQRAWR